MSDTERDNFHHFALETLLFKGRPDLYFCYLKSEKLAHALCLIAGRANAAHAQGQGGALHSLSHEAPHLPGTIARFAAGEIEETSVLADLFELMSLVRLAVSEGELAEHNGRIIAGEYENIAQKVALGKQASPFLSLEDLSVPPFGGGEARGRAALAEHPSVSRTSSSYKGHKDVIKDIKKDNPSSDRSRAILQLIVENKRVSIKDIVKAVHGCSEKTIQRELAGLIRQGLVRKEGERRWSVYLPIERQ